MKSAWGPFAAICLVLCVGVGCSDDDGDDSTMMLDAGPDDLGPVDMGPVPCSDSSECDDSNACTVDRCDAVLGCQNVPACDDGDPCTEDTCDPTVGCSTGALLCADLRADTNRDGLVDLEDPTDDESEDSWDATHGAVLLANLDDDAAACPSEGTLETVAACNDAADTVVNGTADLADLARLRVAAWADAPDDASAELSVASPGVDHVRLFLRGEDDSFEHWTAPHELTAASLRAGVEVGIEATDVVRDPGGWDGFVDLTLSVDGGTGAHGPIPEASDTVRMRVAPLRFPSVLQRATEVRVADANAALVSDLGVALGSTSASLRVLGGLDRFWVGEAYHAAYMAMPGLAGPQTMRVNAMTTPIASSTASELVFRDLRGPGVAGLIGYDRSASTLGDAGSNLLILPPYTHGGESWPHGRALRAATAASGPGDLDPTFQALLEAHDVGPAIYVDGSWLLVPHITYMVTVVPADNDRGWALLIADPELAISLLQDLQSDGFGSAQLFVGKERSGGGSATVSVDEIMADVDIIAANLEAEGALDAVRQRIQDATGLTDEEIIPVPALFEETFGSLAHYLPSLVSGIALSSSVYLTAMPHGPSVDGNPYFEDTFADLLAPLGLDVVFVDTWDAFHVLLGGPSGGVNVERELPASPTW